MDAHVNTHDRAETKRNAARGNPLLELLELEIQVLHTFTSLLFGLEGCGQATCRRNIRVDSGPRSRCIDRTPAGLAPSATEHPTRIGKSKTGASGAPLLSGQAFGRQESLRKPILARRETLPLRKIYSLASLQVFLRM